jgi:hypothetical protein
VLITSIDSTTNLSDSVIGKRILAGDPACKFLGSAVIVPGKSVVRIAERMDLFNGFDELWCFDRFPSTPKMEDSWIVSPFNIETGSIPPSLVSWMAETDCKVGLGDGIGLNFATPQSEVAIMLERFAN